MKTLLHLGFVPLKAKSRSAVELSARWFSFCVSRCLVQGSWRRDLSGWYVVFARASARGFVSLWAAARSAWEVEAVEALLALLAAGRRVGHP